jgi:cytoplasmic iron level regulating protein YaaA (DUF328/UPF0246 family)
MLVILPPSETKVSGGSDSTTVDLATLSFLALTPIRQDVLEQMVALSADLPSALKALKLGPRGLVEVERNAQVFSSPVMPALSRYTGVLYDALDYPGLDSACSAWARDHIAIFSAAWGLLRAGDLIPAYRLSWDSTLAQGKPSRVWRPAGDALWGEVYDFVLDFRSEGYRALAPVPEDRGVFVTLVQPGPPGHRKPLGHANKKTKGQLVHQLAQSRAAISSVEELAGWGNNHGYFFDVASHASGRIDLVISGS